MQERSGKLRPKMVYQTMDVFNMSFSDQSFNVVLDKGCLDAIYPEEEKGIT